MAIPLIGCGKDEEEAKATSTPVATAAAVPPSGFFDSDGVKIHYETFGSGYPIILIHGFTANLKVNWLGPNWVEANPAHPTGCRAGLPQPRRERQAA